MKHVWNFAQSHMSEEWIPLPHHCDSLQSQIFGNLRQPETKSQHGIRSSVKHFNIRRFYLHPNVGLWNWTNTIKWQILKTSGLMFKNKSRRWITTPQAAHCTFFFFLIVLFHGFPCGLSQATQMKQKLKVREFIVSASDFVLHRNWIWNLYFACCANRQVWMLVCVYFLCASTPSRIVILTDPLDLV